MSTSAAGSFLTGFAGGVNDERDRKKAEQDRKDLREYQIMMRDRYQSGSSGEGFQGRYNPTGGGGGGGARIVTSDPVYTELTPYQRAFLNTIAGPESAGAYNVRYSPDGGTTFDVSTGRHPRVYEPGPAGPSSAAGRYQFTWSTWRDTAGENTPFTPENQDKYAWQLAQDRYRKITGQDLDERLRTKGVDGSVLQALAPTWAGLQSGNDGQIANYNASLARYSQPAPLAAPLAQPRTFAAPAPQAPLTFALPAPALAVQQQPAALAFQ